MRPNLFAWQYAGYRAFHSSRANLLIHIVAVPAFVASFVWLVVSLVAARWLHACGAVVAMSFAFAVQGIGHKREANASIPFDGPVDAVSRILVEQFITFPRYVLSGGFVSALRRTPNSRRP